MVVEVEAPRPFSSSLCFALGSWDVDVDEPLAVVDLRLPSIGLLPALIDSSIDFIVGLGGGSLDFLAI